MEAIKAVTSPWVKNAVLNERVGIPELGSVQGCESCAFIAFTFILILCLKISKVAGRRG